MINAPLLSGLVAAAATLAAAGCVSEVEGGKVITLPPESVRYERFIDSPTELTADRVLVQVLTPYRAECAPVVSREYHVSEIAPDRIYLANRAPNANRDPVSLSIRKMRIRGRQSIEVKFSDISALEFEPNPVIILIEAVGVASLRGDGENVLADKVVIRNDEVKGFHSDGREWNAR